MVQIILARRLGEGAMFSGNPDTRSSLPGFKICSRSGKGMKVAVVVQFARKRANRAIGVSRKTPFDALRLLRASYIARLA